MSNLFNLNSFFKFLAKNKLYTFIDVFGLSASLMFVLIIGIYTAQELSVDKFHEKAERIYVLGSEERFGSAAKIGGHIRERYPEIEQVCAVSSPFDNMPVSIGDQKFSSTLLFADSTFFNLFSFPLVKGDRHLAMAAKNYVVISETFARKAFADRDPMGASIQLNDSVTVTVNGIMKDINRTTVPYCDILLHVDQLRYYNSSMISETFDNTGSTLIFILEKKGANLPAKAEDMARFFKDDLKFWIYARSMHTKVIFTPLKEVYFSESQKHVHGFMQGDRRFVMILLSVGILILLFAVTNYINLTVAQTGFRAKEMATRRLLGSGRQELFVRLMLESTLLCFISFIIGLVLAYACTPFANDLLQTRIELNAAINPLNILICCVLILVLGGLSGLLPALVISRTKPIDIVRGGFRKKTKMVFSKAFIVFQNTITIILLAAALTMMLQIHHMIKAPLGYNSVNLMKVDVEQFKNREQVYTFGKEIEALALVRRVGYAQGTPFDRGNNHTSQSGGKNISFQVLIGDSTYFSMFGFQKLRENNLSPSRMTYYVTEQSLKELEISQDAASFPFGNGEMLIAGVYKDFQLGNITHKTSPIMLRELKTGSFGPWSVIIETQGSPLVARQQIQEVYKRFTGLEFTGEYIDKQIEDSFAAQRRTMTIVSIFCGIAVLIALLGLLAMSTYFIQQRARETSVRKVFGSTNRQVLNKLVWTFQNYVLIAFVLAVPVIWYAMNRWLSEYTYRINLSVWIFITAGCFCLLISFITVFWQSYRAAVANPVDNIKAE